jgi:CheY-like chemotaxis protein
MSSCPVVSAASAPVGVADGDVRLSAPRRAPPRNVRRSGVRSRAASPGVGPPSFVVGAPCLLIVDDDAAVRDLLCDRLRTAGFAIHSACDGAAALEVYARRRATIDLVLMDVCMPVLDGPGALKRLRSQSPEVCCCFMSGGLGSYTEPELLALGAAAVLKKPLRTNRLALDLLDVIRRHRAVRSGTSELSAVVETAEIGLLRDVAPRDETPPAALRFGPPPNGDARTTSAARTGG